MKKDSPAQLSGKQKRYLRGLGHHLSQSVLVGRDGISDNLIESCLDGLQAHELIKIKLGQNCPVDKKEAAHELAARTDSHLVQLIGRTILLYRPNPDRAKDEAIALPR